MDLILDRKEAGRLMSLAAPILLGSLATTGMAFTDTVMAGRYSSDDLAGLSLATALYLLILLPLLCLMTAVTPVISSHRGAGDPGRIQETMTQLGRAAALTALAAVLLCLAGSTAAGLLDLEPRVVDVARDYTRIIALGIPFAFAFGWIRALTDGLGNTVITMICCTAGLVCNVGLNYVFIYGHLGLPALGGKGCAVATDLVQILMFLLQILLVRRMAAVRAHRLLSPHPHPDPALIMRYFRLAFPLGLAVFFEVGIFSLFSVLASFMGSQAMAANQILFNFMSVVYMLPMSLSHAASIRTGFHLGAGSFRGMELTVGATLITGMILALALGILSYLFRWEIISFYTGDPQVRELLTDAFICVAVYQIGDYCQTAGTGILRGIQDTAVISVASVGVYWLFTVPCGLVLCFTSLLGGPYGFYGLWVALCISLYMLALIYLKRVSTRFRQGFSGMTGSGAGS